VVAGVLQRLRDAGVADSAVGVLTPYAAQVEALRGELRGVEVGTVDGMQGREKEAIVRAGGGVCDSGRLSLAFAVTLTKTSDSSATIAA
jgi:hypothetical protein